MKLASRTRRLPAPWNYVAALAITALAFAVRLGLLRTDEPVLVVFVLPAALAAFVGGRGPALVSVATSALGALYDLVPPAGRLSVATPVDLAQWALFCVTAVLVALVTDSAYRAGLRVEDAERGATSLATKERADDALRHSEQRLRALFEDAAVGIIEVDEDDRCVAVNGRLCRMLGYDDGAELLGRSLHELTAPEDREVTRALNARGHAGQSRVFEYEKRYLKRDGARLWVHVNVSVVVDAAGRFLRAIGTVEDVSERKRSQEALRFALLGSRSGTFDWDVGAADVRWSDEFLALYGLPRAEFRGRYGDWLACLVPEDRPVAHQALRRALTSGDYVADFRIRRRSDGQIRWMHARGSVTFDPTGKPLRLVGLNVDITERKEAEAALDAERMRWRGVVEGIADEMWVCDASGRVSLINLPDVTEMALEPFEGRTIERVLEDVDILFPDGRPRPPEEAPLLVAMRTGQIVRGEEQMRHRASGRLRHRQYSCAPMRDASGAITGSVAIVRDITELKRTAEALRAANEQLREADRRKDEFLGMLSHELRNPLAPIRNSLYILDHAEPSSPQVGRAREVATRQLTHLTRLVDDLLDVTRIARDKIELRRAELDLAALARRTAEDHRALMQGRHIELTVQTPRDPVWVTGDETRLAQVLGNLLHNAAKFTPGDGQVVLSLAPEDGRAAIRVRDTGAGVEPGMLQAIFEPFIQAKQGLARSEGGLGLGLALVKGLVELHGGEVTATSGGAGLGTEFLVTLPLAAPRVRAGEQRSAPPRARAGARHVLVIDDNRDAAESLAELVSMLGHEAEVAYDGFSALERAAERLPDVVLCDIGLPGMDGYELARQLRALSSHREITLVAVSGYAQPEDVSRAVEVGFDAHVAKPPDPERIAGLLG